MFCKFCGQALPDGAAFCPHCGRAQADSCQNPPPRGLYPYCAAEPDIPSAGWGVLGFFFPLIGLILYLVWQNTMPLRARMCGKGALIGVIAEVALAVIGYIIVIILMAALLSVAGTHTTIGG